MQAGAAILAVFVFAAPAMLAAQSPQVKTSDQMTVAAFMDRVSELRRDGPEWPLSPEAGELFAAISSAGTTYRQHLRDQVAAGNPAEACLPPEAELGSDVLLQHLAAYPEPEARQTSIREAFAQLVRKRFPCP